MMRSAKSSLLNLQLRCATASCIMWIRKSFTPWSGETRAASPSGHPETGGRLVF